jgi:hypothetical protein
MRAGTRRKRMCGRNGSTAMSSGSGGGFHGGFEDGTNDTPERTGKSKEAEGMEEGRDR